MEQEMSAAPALASVQGAGHVPGSGAPHERRGMNLWRWFRPAPKDAQPRHASRFDARRMRRLLVECVQGTGGEASARRRVATLAAVYRALNDEGRRNFLAILVAETNAEEESVTAAVRGYLESPGTVRALAASRLKAALAGARIRVFRQFNLLHDGVKFLVDLRADAMRFAREARELAPIDDDLFMLLSDWFDVGNLELRRITWNSPAALLEKLMAYEAVHEIRSWADLRHRLDSDRRCYAFFHPRMPDEPLVFVEVALMRRVAASIHLLLDESAPASDANGADVAVFYSISSTQIGLRGVSLGGFLIKRVVEQLLADFPRMTTFATLSPVPKFRRWLEQKLNADRELHVSERDRLVLQTLTGKQGAGAAIRAALERDFTADPVLDKALHAVLLPLCARYLAQEKADGLPVDPVARFHLGNGARLDRLNWRADTSPHGLQQSLGIMVNYLYKPAEIDSNHEAYVRRGKVAVSRSMRSLMRRNRIMNAE